jgi:hypothetical protein
MIEEKATRSELDQFTTTSNASRWKVFLFLVAGAIAIYEQIQDAFKTEVTDIRSKEKVGTLAWFRAQALVFQYSATTPQAVEIIDYVPAYPVIDESLRIVTQAAAIALNEDIQLKIAKGTYPNFTALDAQELAAISTYFNGSNSGAVEGITFAGKKVVFISQDSDRLYINADIYYNGQFTQAQVQQNIEDSLNIFLSSFTDQAFNGVLFYQRIVDAIQATEGVSDVKINSFAGRPYNTAFANRVIFDRIYQSSAGHVILEDDTGNTINHSLNYIVV